MKETSHTLKFGRHCTGFAFLNFVVIASAWAHNPVAECKLIASDSIQCKGGFADGDNAAGMTVNLMSNDNKIIQAGKLGKDSMIIFKKPKGEFHVRFDAGSDDMIEIDHSEIRLGAFKN